MDEKCPNALLMLGDLELKNDDWVKAKDTFKAAKDASDGKDSYATLCLVNKLFRLPLSSSYYTSFSIILVIDLFILHVVCT